MKFCENFYSSRISADKRFQNKLHPYPLYPGQGVGSDEPHPIAVVRKTVCNHKVMNIFK